MRRSFVLAILVLLAFTQASNAADLQAGWYVEVGPVTVYNYSYYYGYLPYASAWFPLEPGNYGPFLLTDGPYHYRGERVVSVTSNVYGIGPSSSLTLPMGFGLTIGDQIGYIGVGWQTNYDPTQMCLQLWRTRYDGREELVWSQTLGGIKYGSTDLLHNSYVEGSYFLKIAIAPPGGFSDLSPPDITVHSPQKYHTYYNYSTDRIPINIAIKDYGSGTSGVNILLDGKPFPESVTYAEQSDNVLQITSGIDISNMENGHHELKVTARDKAANVNVQSVTFTLQKLDGSIVGWGSYELDKALPPSNLTDMVAISAGGGYSLALKSDGTIVSWGLRITPPQGLTDVTAVSAGDFSGLYPSHEHSLALRSDGTVVGWGDNADGQSTPPQDLRDVIAVSAGGQHSLALKSDGTVVGWGENDSGQATPPQGLTNVVAISAGPSHSLALKSDGTVIGWGWNSFRQTTPPSGLTDVIAISAGFRHSLALKADGTVVGWGDNFYGQVAPPSGLRDVVAIAAGMWQSLALKSDGTVVGWGSNLNRETIPPERLTNVVAISTGDQYSLALRDITPPSIVIQSPTSGQTYYNTGITIPVDLGITDDFDPKPDVMLTLDGQSLPSSEITISALAFGDHTLQVTARDRFGNEVTKSVTFKVTPKPIPFCVKDLRVEWKHDAGKANKIKLSGEFSIPDSYLPNQLSTEAFVLIEIGGVKGKDVILGKLKIDWKNNEGKLNKFTLDGDLDSGVFNDGSGRVTVTLILPVISGGDLAGTETVTCRIKQDTWDYHK